MLQVIFMYLHFDPSQVLAALGPASVALVSSLSCQVEPGQDSHNFRKPKGIMESVTEPQLQMQEFRFARRLSFHVKRSTNKKVCRHPEDRSGCPSLEGHIVYEGGWIVNLNILSRLNQANPTVRTISEPEIIKASAEQSA